MTKDECSCGAPIEVDLTRRAFVKGTLATGALTLSGCGVKPVSQGASQSQAPPPGEGARGGSILVRNVRLSDDKPPVEIAIDNGVPSLPSDRI
jgi:hypothetical protein